VGEGRLYIVATPIGNLDDLTARAARVLGEVDLIAAEDTRHTARLLQRYGVRTPTTSYHEHNEREKTGRLLEVLEGGGAVALVSDAGTPGIADPGYRLVRAARDAGHEVVAVPGPCAFVAALSVSGLPVDRFTFHGFFPRKRSAAEALCGVIAAAPGTHIFYESPRRLAASLRMLAGHLPGAHACVARELTKVHEEVVEGRCGDLADRYEAAPPRGECVVLVHPAEAAPQAALTDADLAERVDALMAARGLSRRDAVRRVAEETGEPRNRVYTAAGRRP
jgi:16S rRNA (cytidine1402-2'-O)-methyltransferase